MFHIEDPEYMLIEDETLVQMSFCGRRMPRPDIIPWAKARQTILEEEVCVECSLGAFEAGATL